MSSTRNTRFIGTGTNPLNGFVLFLLIVCWTTLLNAQDEGCPTWNNKRTDKEFEKAKRAYRQYNYSECIGTLQEIIGLEPDYADAYFMLGLVYIEDSRMNLIQAKLNFEHVIEICPDYEIYAYYHLARIAYGAKEYKEALDYINVFLEDVDKIRSDNDYNEAVAIQEYAGFYHKTLNSPVPFDPKPVAGISTKEDEYLPIISPDNELALFTRRLEIPTRRDDLTPQAKYRERFMVSRRFGDKFDPGESMPTPFNMHDNEGGATLTIDNKELFYTLCRYTTTGYYNCDICYSKRVGNSWSEITSIGKQVNLDNTWESQPSITSDGNTLYFVSDRPGGLGGYDIYETTRDSTGIWSAPKNLGQGINTAGNEKSPFIHTDSQTLYFSSDGLMGLGGYDIFFTKLDSNNLWNNPQNIGHPINSYEDDVGFFVSTDGHKGYFASNKFDGFGGWDLYYFDLYEEARPEKVLFVKGDIKNMLDQGFKNTKVELKNVESKKITDIPVDTLTGEYVAAVLFRDDYILTVKDKGFVNEARYLAKVDPKTVQPLSMQIDLKPIEIGMTYRLHDIYFDFNSFELPLESKAVLQEFYEFLKDNPGLRVSIEGHTDNIGNDNNNLVLSEKRAKAVHQYLLNLGIKQSRIAYKGFGESRPIADNNTDDGRAMNRRTEFVIIDK